MMQNGMECSDMDEDLRHHRGICGGKETSYDKRDNSSNAAVSCVYNNHLACFFL